MIVWLHVSVCVVSIRWLSAAATLTLSTFRDVAHEKTDGTVGRVPECHFLPGPLLRCHIAGMASVLIRGPTDATLHLHAVTQPESTDSDEVDAWNRRPGKPPLPLLLFVFFFP